MPDAPLQSEIFAVLGQLPEAMQRQILDYARDLAKSPTLSDSKSGLLKFAGILSDAEASEMESAIQSGCEKVDLDEW